MTIKQQVCDKLMREGKIDNFYCIDNRWTTRLGAVIHSLQKEGKVEIDEEKSGFLGDSKNWQYILKTKSTLF